MYQTINFSAFCDAFRSMGRNDNFTYDGKRALFDYLEEYEESCNEKVELDIIALCCEYTEYKDLAEFQEAYDSGYQTMDDIENATLVIPIEGDSFIIPNF